MMPQEIQILERVTGEVITVNLARVYTQKAADTGDPVKVKGMMGGFTDAQLKDLGEKITAYFAAK